MWSKLPLPVCAALSVALSLLVGSVVAARAEGPQAVDVRFSTRVAAGEKPKVIFQVNRPVSRLTLELTDDGGQATRAEFTDLGPGQARTVPLPALPGRRRYRGRVVVVQGGQTSESPLAFEAVVAPRLALTVDRTRVDLPGRRLEARFSQPAARAVVEVVGATGGPPLTVTEQPLGQRPAGEPLSIAWPPPPADRGEAAVGRIDLRVYDSDGFYAGVSLYPWSVYIPHEEVGFATDSAAIAPPEERKLEASHKLIAEALARHRELGPIKLYIAGHTDTVGADAYNLQLSLRRARAIAGWFRQRGLRLPILFEGFGEQALARATPDGTDEVRNRRVDYILAVEDPVLHAPRFRAVWKSLP